MKTEDLIYLMTAIVASADLRDDPKVVAAAATDVVTEIFRAWRDRADAKRETELSPLERILS